MRLEQVNKRSSFLSSSKLVQIFNTILHLYPSRCFNMKHTDRCADEHTWNYRSVCALHAMNRKYADHPWFQSSALNVPHENSRLIEEQNHIWSSYCRRRGVDVRRRHKRHVLLDNIHEQGVWEISHLSIFSHLLRLRWLNLWELPNYWSKPVVPKRCVATPWCVGRDHEVCREIKKKIKLRLMMIINNWTNDLSN
jgi:hypothetical protein